MELDPKALERAAEQHDNYTRPGLVGALTAARNSREIIQAYLTAIGGTHVLVPREPTEAMLKAAFASMNATPSGEWKRMKASGQKPRQIFDAKMIPRYRAMLAAASPVKGG